MLNAIKRLSSTYGNDIKIVRNFEFTRSASVELELQPLLEALEYCKTSRYKIKYAIIKSIDRATRAGSTVYAYLKSEFAKIGVTLIDTYGVISSETINTLEHLGLKYKWSEYSPSWITEILEAERAKKEVSDILTRLIGAEAHYVQLGYRVRPAPPGYRNGRIETQHGNRVILEPHPIESLWFIRMFELRGQGNLSDPEIVDQVNILGFKSRRMKIHDRHDPTKIIGHKGQKPLTVKQFQRYIQNPIYAGINTEKWTNGKPVKMNFKGLVSIELFNKANRGKVTIIDNGSEIEVIKGKPKLWQLKKLKDNPEFPFKHEILCPVCRKPLLGSSPRNKAGNHIPSYHCSRNHPYWSVNRTVFNEYIRRFIERVHFSEDFKKSFKEIVIEEWRKREKQLSEDSVNVGKQVIRIEQEIQSLKEKLKVLTQPTALKLIEEDLERLQLDKIRTTALRDKKEDEQLDIQLLMNYTQFYMEHLEDLIINTLNPKQTGTLFGLMFEEKPTYQELVNGTPKLAPLFKLNEEWEHSKEHSVRRLGLDSNSNNNLKTAVQRLNC